MFRSLALQTNIYKSVSCATPLLSNGALQTICLQFQGKKRTIFSEASLGIPEYIEERERKEKQYPAEQISEFFQNINTNLNGVKKSSGVVFLNDLKNAVHICKENDEHLSTLDNMIKKYYSQKSTNSFGQFTLGPVLMRLYYHLNLPHMALDALNSVYSKKIFQDSASFKIALTLLYNNGMYTEVLDLLDKIIKGRLCGHNHPKNCIIIAFAAVLKMDTDEGYARGLKLVQTTIGNSGHIPGMHRRLLALAGCVAIKAKRPDITLNILKNNSWPNFPSIKNLTVLSWCQVNEVSESLSSIRSMKSTRRNNSLKDKCFIYEHVLDAVRESVKKSNVPDLREEFKLVNKSLIDGALISDQNLFEEVLTPLYSFESKNMNSLHSDSEQTPNFNRLPTNRRNRRHSTIMDTLEG